MKSILIGLASVISMLTASTAIADLLGEKDDTYIGFQVKVPVAVSRSKLISGRNEYSALFVSQHNGMRDGMVFTRTTDGNRTLGYLRPSTTYSITQSQVSDYTIPVVMLDGGSEIKSAFAVDGLAGVAVVLVSMVVVAKELLEESVDCINPEINSEEIAGC